MHIMMIIKKKMKDYSMREGLRQKGYMAILWAQTTDLAPLIKRTLDKCANHSDLHILGPISFCH